MPNNFEQLFQSEILYQQYLLEEGNWENFFSFFHFKTQKKKKNF